MLPEEALDVMTAWYDKHYTNPYPSFKDFEELASAGRVSIKQVKQWFVNVRRRTYNQFRKRRTNKNSRYSRDNSNQEEILKSLPLSRDDSGISNSKEIIDENNVNESVSPYTVYNQTKGTPNYSNISNNLNDSANNSQYYNQSFESPRLQYSNYNYNYTSTPAIQRYNTSPQHIYLNYEIDSGYNNYEYQQQPVNMDLNDYNSYNQFSNNA